MLAASLGAIAAVVVLRAGTDEDPDQTTALAADECPLLPAGAARECYARAFLTFVEGRDDPRPAVATIAASARREGGFLLTNCHGIMHTVGRTYARERGVRLATLRDFLPRSNDPGCPAGFAHGVVTGVAPLLDPRRPREAARVCEGAATRYQLYSCIHGLGHAFMRIHGDRLPPALELCRALGRQAPDCAQGAYHDYWFAVAGVDDASAAGVAARDPWRLCADEPQMFVRPCWYRAFVDNRPALDVETARDLDELCADLDGLQREACVTAAAVIGPADPAAQLALCAELESVSDAAGCVRGTKVQNLLGAPIAGYVALIRRCEAFDPAARPACYRWLGKTIAVVTDGAFGREGCPRLAGAARRACSAGARSIDDALVTFS